MMLRGAIEYGEHHLTYKARFTSRTTLAISVYPDQSIELLAPQGTSQAELEHRLRKRARWVCRQIRYFEQFIPRTPPRRYVGGETHLYLGKQFRLKVRRGDVKGVRLTRGQFEVTVQDCNDPRQIRKLLDEWLRARALARLESRFALILTTFRFPARLQPSLQIRLMKQRWGSRSTRATITLNPRLIGAPLRCIDYVITHELCHVLKPHHGPEFFRLLARHMPDWQQRKNQLERLLT